MAPRTINPFADGPVVRGNVDLYRQPEVRNADGSISTVDSSSYNVGGREVLLPSVTQDGRHLATDDEILAEYARSGQHMGMFATPDDATYAAEGIHDAYARGEYRQPQYVDSRAMYAPDADIAFGDRMQLARSQRPPSGARYALAHPQQDYAAHVARPLATIDPFSDGQQMLAQGDGSTIKITPPQYAGLAPAYRPQGRPTYGA